MKIQYEYFVYPLNSDKETGYKAVIPAFNNGIVFGETVQELEQGIIFSIAESIKELKKEGKKVPKPAKTLQASGKILIRTTPILHERLILEAKASNKSLNAYIQEKLTN